MNKLFFIKTFGCQMNDRDSAIMAQILRSAGFSECSSTSEADLIILNTCSIRAKAEHKVISLLGSLRELKRIKPHLMICVAGCVAQQEGQRLIERMPLVDLVIGTQQIYNIGSLLEECSKRKGLVAHDLSERYAIPAFLPDLNCTRPNDGFSRLVTIMQGCNNYCAYCVVPYTRGRENSRIVSHILDEIKVLLESGVKEITLLGQNVNSYGSNSIVKPDHENYAFPDLLHEIANLPGLVRLRFTTSNPKDLSPALMQCFRDIPQLCPHFHLPAQSGSTAILKKMNRKYSREQYLELVDQLQYYQPKIALSTDIIVGFPGESDSDFMATMDLLETVRFHASFSFKYSDRPGTASLHFPGKISETVKSERLRLFQKRQDEISLERNNEYIGNKEKILLERVDTDGICGRTGTNHLVHLPFSSNFHSEPGNLLTVRIIGVGKHSLQGEILSRNE